MRNFFLFNKYHYGGKMTEDEMGTSHSKHWLAGLLGRLKARQLLGMEKEKYKVILKIPREITPAWRPAHIHWRIILKCILKQ
jgi:hypothetical protein